MLWPNFPIWHRPKRVLQEPSPCPRPRKRLPFFASTVRPWSLWTVPGSVLTGSRRCFLCQNRSCSPLKRGAQFQALLRGKKGGQVVGFGCASTDRAQMSGAGDGLKVQKNRRPGDLVQGPADNRMHLRFCHGGAFRNLGTRPRSSEPLPAWARQMQGSGERPVPYCHPATRGRRAHGNTDSDFQREVFHV